MSTGGAPLGNKNAARGRRWREALDKALKQFSYAGFVDKATGLYAVDPVAPGQALERIARNVVYRAVVHQDRDCEEEIATRLDGKPTQPLAGDDEAPPILAKIVREIIRPAPRPPIDAPPEGRDESQGP
jgi:hypothetical protein